MLLQHIFERVVTDVGAFDQTLCASVLIGDDNDGPARAALLVQGLQNFEFHAIILPKADSPPAYSTFSTNTRILPPQDSPTFQAVSSATPNSRVRGLPLSITSIASVTTAPSTQPPDTEPRKLPWSSITRLEPTGRGAEPQVSTTVATATPRPAFFQSSAALRMSSSLASMRCLRCVEKRDFPGL